MNTKRLSLNVYAGLSSLILVMMGLVGCQTASPFVNHPQPELEVDVTAFEGVGCPPGEYGFRRCEENSVLANLGCHEIRAPSDLLGGLEPSYPLIECLVIPDLDSGEVGYRPPSEEEYFFNVGGIVPIYVRYVIFRDGRCELIEEEGEFRDIFAPVTIPEEALSYVLAVRNLWAYYDLQPDAGLKYYVDQIEDTYVEETEDGFLVHLFYYEVFGCGPHFTYAVDMQVTTYGQVQEIGRERIYKDPSEDDLCAD